MCHGSAGAFAEGEAVRRSPISGKLNRPGLVCHAANGQAEGQKAYQPTNLDQEGSKGIPACGGHHLLTLLRVYAWTGLFELLKPLPFCPRNVDMRVVEVFISAFITAILLAHPASNVFLAAP